MAEERLQKILARAGVSSRRAAEQIIHEGRVRVNGQVVTELGSRADIERDRIEVDGKPVARPEAFKYFLVHKPRGMVTTLRDPEGRPSLSELLGGIPERVYPVGRLDFHTSGALLLTNDGDLAQALLHPSREVPKTYVAKLNRPAEPRMIAELRRGVTLDDGYRTRPAHVVELRNEEQKTWLEITITEGKNRQIHRMVEAVGPLVMRLSRVSFAGLSTEGLRPGQLRELTPAELERLRREYLPNYKPQRGQPSSERERDDRGERSQSRGAGHAAARTPSRGKGPSPAGSERGPRRPERPNQANDRNPSKKVRNRPPRV